MSGMAEMGYMSDRKLPQYELDTSFYDEVRAAKPRYELVDRFELPPLSGRGFTVKKGQTFTFVTVGGPQVGDVALWNAHDSREYFVATRTWVLEGFVIKVGTRLWSEVPWMRPMATCIEDTVVPEPPDSVYHHADSRTHCTSELWEMRSGVAGLDSCHLNFLQAIEPFGLGEADIHGNFMVHQKTYVEPEKGRARVARGDSKPGDYISFYAEIDLLVALSTCPMGDGIRDVATGEGEAYPIGVEVHETGIQPREFPRWTDWRPGWTGKWEPAQA